MAQELYTIQQIAQKLNIAESTVRYYRDRFPEFMPTVGEGRKRRYKAETIEIIKVIADMLRNNQTAELITERLRLKYAMFQGVNDETAATATQNAAAQQQEMEMAISTAIESKNEVIAVLRSAIESQQQQILKLQQEKSSLEEKSDKLLNEYMEINKRYRQALEKKSLWELLFRRKDIK